MFLPVETYFLSLDLAFTSVVMSHYFDADGRQLCFALNQWIDLSGALLAHFSF